MPHSPQHKGFHVIRPLLIAALLGLLLAVTACRPKAQGGSNDEKQLRIACTFLPVYVFTLNVVGDTPDVDVQLLVDRDVGCPHSYSLTGRDQKLLSRADLVIANGLGAEPFLEQATRGRRDLKILTISDDCDLIGAEPGQAGAHDAHGGHENHAETDVQAEEHADHEGHENCDHDHAADAHDHDAEVNSHTWVSPRQAAKQVRTLARKLAQEDPARAEVYHANANAYAARLEALAERMELAAQGFTNRNIVTGHASFDYLARDLGLNVVATLRVIPGETGSATEMAHVIDTIRETKPGAVFWEPPFGDKMAEAVARETGVAVYPLNPFNTDAGLPEAKTLDAKRRLYEEVMDQNLATLQRALSAPASRP